MPQIFNKRGKVIIARPLDALPDGYFTPQANAIEVSLLRFSFEVESHLGPEPNTCNIVIGNLNESSRTAVQKRPIKVQLFAGWGDGTDVALIASGDIRYAKSAPSGANWLTTLQVGDGARAIGRARLSRSYSRGSTPRDAIRDIAGSMGLKVPTSVGEAKDLLTQFGAGLSLHGFSRDHMTTVLKPRGYAWSVQRDKLVIQKAIQTADTELIVSEYTGLVGDPEFGTPKKVGQPPSLNLRMLLYPAMEPGRKIRLESRTARGTYKLVRVKHTGDTHGPLWTTELEARPL